MLANNDIRSDGLKQSSLSEKILVYSSHRPPGGTSSSTPAYHWSGAVLTEIFTKPGFSPADFSLYIVFTLHLLFLLLVDNYDFTSQLLASNFDDILKL